MERFLYNQLKNWKDSKTRKPLILEGARQVGKTWLLKQFGKNEFENFIYINCDNNPQMESIFADYDVKRILRNLSAISNIKIESGKCFIIFDEVQEFPKALTSLKYFCEDAPEIHVAAALTGLQRVPTRMWAKADKSARILPAKFLSRQDVVSFPVGKVDSLYLYPLSYMEFLVALGKNILVEQIRNHNWQELNALNPQMTELLRQYYFTGGMPAVVKSYVEEQDLQKVRSIQNQILSDYLHDVSKHAPKTEIPKITLVWNSIPSQLAKENKKFIYGAIKKGGRAKEFENAIQWLINAGLVHKVFRIKKFEQPLKFYEDFDCFKLYVNDLGLLGAMAQTPASEILVGNSAFSSYKGSFTEQYVAQQFYSADSGAVNSRGLYYYTNENSTMEIDFVFQTDKVYPVEVKAEQNLKAKSLSTVLKNDEKLFGIRFSMADYIEQSQMVNVPLALTEEYLRSL